MSKHTPGPWKIQTSCSFRRIGNNMGDGNVCYPCNQPDGHPDLTFQNGGFDGPDARLIASAPDLLEACQEYAAWADKVACKDADLRAIREKIRAAIAKALGEQP